MRKKPNIVNKYRKAGGSQKVWRKEEILGWKLGSTVLYPELCNGYPLNGWLMYRDNQQALDPVGILSIRWRYGLRPAQTLWLLPTCGLKLPGLKYCAIQSTVHRRRQNTGGMRRSIRVQEQGFPMTFVDALCNGRIYKGYR